MILSFMLSFFSKPPKNCSKCSSIIVVTVFYC